MLIAGILGIISFFVILFLLFIRTTWKATKSLFVRCFAVGAFLLLLGREGTRAWLTILLK